MSLQLMSDPDQLWCGPISESVFTSADTVVFVLAASFLFWKIARARANAEAGNQQAADVLVYPIYFTFIKIEMVYILLLALTLHFMPTSYTVVGMIVQGVMNAGGSTIRVSVGVYIVQAHVGMRAMRRTMIFGALAFIVVISLSLYFYLTARVASHNYMVRQQNMFFYVYDGGTLLWHIIILLMMIIKRHDRYTRFHYFYPTYYIFVFLAYLSGDIICDLTTWTSWGECIPLLTQCVSFSCATFVTYYTLRADSNYWRRAGSVKLKISPVNSDDVRDSTVALLSTADESVRHSIPPTARLIDFGRLQMGRVLGQGGAGTVYQGILDGNTLVAVKRMPCWDLTRKEIKRYLQEVEIASRLEHPNIIKLHGVCVLVPDIAMVMEFAERGSLFDVLRKGQATNSHRKLKMATDCARAIAFLHSQSPPLVHNDVKSLNFLVDRNWNVKLSDFGESRNISEHGALIHTVNVVKSTLNWMSPEAMLEGKHSEKSDVYSLGMVLYEIWAERPPFESLPPYRVHQIVIEEKRRPALPADCPKAYKAIVEQCWQDSDAARPTAEQVVSVLERLSVEETADSEESS